MVDHEWLVLYGGVRYELVSRDLMSGDAQGAQRSDGHILSPVVDEITAAMPSRCQESLGLPTIFFARNQRSSHVLQLVEPDQCLT